MLEIKKLLARKTVKNFLAKKVDLEILEKAIKVAHHTPTSLNSRPVILLDISKHKAEAWISIQPAVPTAPHLFLLASNPDRGEANAREFLAGRYGGEIGDEQVEVVMQRIATNKKEWATQQVYLTAGYFSATLEASGVAGCWIAGFDKEECAKSVELPEGYTPELIFACGYADPQDPATNETESARKFEDFYFPEKQ
ncbi:MAG: nitroreductase family protein [Patescibacteria group bacterium]